MIDLALDRGTHDLYIPADDLVLVTGLEQLQQNLTIRLRFFLREWFLDENAGVPYYDDILIKNPNVPDIENILKSYILDTPDVIELLEFDTVFEPTQRTLEVSFKARTNFGIADLSVSVF